MIIWNGQNRLGVSWCQWGMEWCQGKAAGRRKMWEQKAVLLIFKLSEVTS